jgi:hypothetical protein
MDWVEHRVKEIEDVNGPLNIMYGIDGRHELTEETLDHLSGYRDSRPVRIGNGAYNQLQLDIYGEVIDSIYLFNRYSTPSAIRSGATSGRMLDWVARNWELPDEGIWEVRSGRQHFVYSNSSAGSPSTAASASPTPAASPSNANAFNASATASTKPSWSAATTRKRAPSSSPSNQRLSTPPTS